jgi:hypothetical protein
MSTGSALTRARDHAGAALSSLGEAAEELAHEAKDLLDRELPVLAEKASGAVGELAHRAEDLLDSDRVTEVRKELAARIDPDPRAPKRWWWIGAGIAVTVASVIGWLVLSRRPQELPHEEAPSTNPPGSVDLAPEPPAHATRNGHS